MDGRREPPPFLCRLCGASVTLATSRTGPVVVNPTTIRVMPGPSGRVTVVLEDGRVMRGEVAETQRRRVGLEVLGRVLHVETCPAGERAVALGHSPGLDGPPAPVDSGQVRRGRRGEGT